MYNCDTNERINFSKSVYIGDHVWVGQSAIILKGTEIDSGSIIGAGSVVPGKKIPHNTVWAGNPCRQINTNIFWDKTSLHDFTEKTTLQSLHYLDFMDEKKSTVDSDMYIFKYIEDESIKWEVLEEQLSTGYSRDKCNFIYRLSHDKNRFVHRFCDKMDRYEN